MDLHRYWFEFEGAALELPPGIGIGCGVTASNFDEAVALMKDRVFGGHDLPWIQAVTEDVDVSELDAKHVLPNIGDVLAKGVWYPLGH